MKNQKKIDKQEKNTKEVIDEIKSVYENSISHLDENTKVQLKVASDLKEELGNSDFDKNIEELKALRDEIFRLKSEINKLNDMKDITFSSLIIKDVKAVGEKIFNLHDKAVDSLKNLYGNIKNQLSYNLTKAQEKFVQAKIGVVKGLVNTMQDFIKSQQKKLDACMEKLDSLAEEIQKDEKEFVNKENTEKTNETEVKDEIKPEIKEEVKAEEKEEKKVEVKEENSAEEKTKVSKKTATKSSKSKTEKSEKPKKSAEKSTVKVNQSLIKLKIKENQSKKRPSVLQKLEENKGKVDRYDKNKGEKAIKKDKGMEI